MNHLVKCTLDYAMCLSFLFADERIHCEASSRNGRVVPLQPFGPDRHVGNTQLWVIICVTSEMTSVPPASR